MARTKLKKKHYFTTSHTRIHAESNRKVIRGLGISRRSDRLHQENFDDYYDGDVKEFGITMQDYKLCLNDSILQDQQDLINQDRPSRSLKRRSLKEMWANKSWEEDIFFVDEEED